MARKASRKGTKNWRKHTDISDVQDSIHELQTEAKLGGIISKKADQDLFVLDSRGDSSIVTRDQVKKLRIDEILKPSSSFSLSRTKSVSTKKAKTNTKLRKQPVSPSKPQSESQSTDLWENSNPASLRISRKSSQLPLAGQSYKPSEEDHLKCLQKAAEIVEAIEDGMQNRSKPNFSLPILNRTSDEMIKKANDEFFFLKNSESKSDMREDVNGEEFKIDLERAKKPRLSKEKMKRIQKEKLSNDINNISQILNEISKPHSSRIHKSSTHKFNPAIMPLIPAVKLPEEIPDSLRELVPEGNLWKEKYALLQQSGIVPPKKNNTRPKRKARYAIVRRK